ncbi:hypothetical protein MRB53_025981 [Persea americana]|uniref:Uncharacterized protein n=1 Tax=Persea americana TaxID=3435 RepID=A0ACC2LHA7_PERAE|nr:hypothetical protein MRB53_025981 [Persea americana]
MRSPALVSRLQLSLYSNRLPNLHRWSLLSNLRMAYFSQTLLSLHLCVRTMPISLQFPSLVKLLSAGCQSPISLSRQASLVKLLSAGNLPLSSSSLRGVATLSADDSPSPISPLHGITEKGQFFHKKRQENHPLFSDSVLQSMKNCDFAFKILQTVMFID